MMTQMTDVYHLVLLPDTDEEAFVAFAQQEGFARAAVTRAGTVTSQYLLKEHDGDDGRRRYMWIVRWTSHVELEALEHIARSLWKVAQPLESQAEMTSFARYVQVAESTAHS
jgi:hypothetical protein